MNFAGLWGELKKSEIWLRCPFIGAFGRRLTPELEALLVKERTLDTRVFKGLDLSTAVDVMIGASMAGMLCRWADHEQLQLVLPDGTYFHLGRAPTYERPRTFAQYQKACPSAVAPFVAEFGRSFDAEGLTSLWTPKSQRSHDLRRGQLLVRGDCDAQKFAIGGKVVMTTVLTTGLLPHVDGKPLFGPICDWMHSRLHSASAT